MGVLQVVMILFRLMLQSRAEFAAENLALRQQIAILQRSVKRPKVHRRGPNGETGQGDRRVSSAGYFESLVSDWSDCSFIISSITSSILSTCFRCASITALSFSCADSRISFTTSRLIASKPA